jgi:predicted MFS family arabinose efflux permease
MSPELSIFGFIVLDTLCGSWTVTYYGDRIVSFGGTASLIGLMVAMRALCTTFAAPFLGRLTDKVGRRPVALLVVSGTLLTTILEFFASDLWTYGLSRVTFGLSRVCVTVANSMICDLVTDSKARGAALGRNFAAVGVGFLLGSALGGVLASPLDDYFTASLISLTIASISFVWTFLFVKETSHPVAKDSVGVAKSDAKAKVSLIGALGEILSKSDLRTLFLFHTLALICNISPQHAYFEFMRTELALPTAVRGLFLVGIGVATVVAQSSFSAVVAKIGLSRFVTICLLGGAITTCLAPIAGIVVFSTTTLFSCFFGVVTSASLSTLSNASPAHLSGTVNGLHESLSNMALMIGGLYVPATSKIHLFAPFWISGIGMALTLLLVRPTLLHESGKDTKKKTE